MPILYRFSTFVFSYMRIFDLLERQITHSNWVRLERFTHVEIRLDREFYEDGTSWEESDECFTRFCRRSLGKLALVEPSRRPLMTVTLRMDPAIMAYEGFDEVLKSWRNEPLTQSLCALVGFRAVILEWHHCCECTRRRILPDIPIDPPCKAARQFQASDNPLRKRLEQALGPGGVEDISLWKREGDIWSSRPKVLQGYYNCHHRRWIFVPGAFEGGHSMRDVDKLLIDRRRCADCNHSSYRLHGPRSG